MRYTQLALAVSLAATGFNSFAKDKEFEHIQIISHQTSLRTEAGSATLIDEAQLEEFEYDDIHRILAQVPGVNIRQEDGYGLRPNIGFRGVTPERSKKITILEDGVLIGPSPYSAPAAYYFPVTTRMTAVEVFKGPAAIKYGPQTVAGTLNLVTRQVPDYASGALDLAIGSDGYKKAHGYYGDRIGDVGFLVEGVTLKADGFKELDGGDDTGFDKNDFLVKLDYKIAGQEYDQRLELKLSYADEESDETYLGLTDEDFNENPYRRYAASQPANMDTKHTQIMFTHQLSGEDLNLTTRIYRNDYERAWLKLNSLSNSSASLSDIIAFPEQFSGQYDVITGQRDSVVAGETNYFLNMGTNDRSYYSQGIQIDGNWQLALFDLAHTLSFGIRLHQDEIERDHFEDTYAMTDSINTLVDGSRRFTTQNTESTGAWSVYVEDQISLDKLTLGLGLRGEFMDMEYQNDSAGEGDDWQQKTSQIWLPGVSGFYQLSDNSGLLFGVHQGFVPSSPATAVKDGEDEFEKSVNYELGGRFNNGNTTLEVVGFLNDYSNLTESCGQSNCGSQAQLDRSFSGGEVDVWGLETQFKHTYTLTDTLDLPINFTYTYTDSEFKEEFFSEFIQWGHVRAGDSLPYLADHQASLNLGVRHNDWYVDMLVKYTSDMAETAGVSYEGFDLALAGKHVPSRTVVDLAAGYDLVNYGQIYLKLDNLFDDDKLVSRRPYGARPSKPRTLTVGYKFSF
ncbi:TonB-dependent receptor family protein [Pseudoalteromonas sp. ZZD1]|uniref:TonB-dependent receptor family protein n=1 Tax=Pseudoalteromonas sp. ZZD1 TaxID=3139395 RepID=UPI003BAA2A52